jgi:hypothetical protein
MKTCIDCKIQKPLSEFEFRKDTQKHRYLLIFDKKLKVLWKERPYPKKSI